MIQALPQSDNIQVMVTGQETGPAMTFGNEFDNIE